MNNKEIEELLGNQKFRAWIVSFIDLRIERACEADGRVTDEIQEAIKEAK